MIKCPKCNKEFEDDVKFCDACGASFVEEAPEEVAAETAAPEATEETLADKGKSLIKGLKINKKIVTIGAAVVALVLVVSFIISLFGGNKAPNYAVYVKDGDLFSSKVSGGKAWQVTDDGAGSGSVTIVDKTIFYFEEESGNLYFRTIGSKKEGAKIASDVSNYSVSENGKLVTYKATDGDLYQHNLKEKTKIAGDISYFVVTEDGKNIVYVTEEGDLYAKYGKKDAVKIDSEISYVESLSEDLKNVYYRKDNDLYKKIGNKDKEKIASHVEDAGLWEDGTGYYTVKKESDEEATLYYYNGKKATEIEKGDIDIYDGALDEAVIVYVVMDDKGETEAVKVAVKAKVSELKQNEATGYSLSNDGKTLYFIDNVDEGHGDLYEAKISGGKVKDPKKIDSEVYRVRGITEKGKLLYAKDYDEEDGTYELYFDGKKVASDVSFFRYHEDTNAIIYEADESVSIYKGKKSKKIADEVHDWEVTPGGEVLYLTDYEDGEGTLNIYKGSKSKKLDDDVAYIVNYNYHAE